jgi:flagellar motility protein MotE (MotC chaperone)
MKNKILSTFAMTATLALATNVLGRSDGLNMYVYAENQIDQNQTMATSEAESVTMKLQELKNSLKDLSTVGVEKFNQNLNDTYNQLSQQIDKMDDKKDKCIKGLKESLSQLQKHMEKYQKAEAVEQKKLRRTIIIKLDELNKATNKYKETLTNNTEAS